MPWRTTAGASGATCRLFEIGSAFSSQDGETRRAAFAWTGAASPEHWSGTGRGVDFFDARGAVERLATAAWRPPSSSRPPGCRGSWPGKARRCRAATGGPTPGLALGVVGQLQPSIAASARRAGRRRDVCRGDRSRSARRGRAAVATDLQGRRRCRAIHRSCATSRCSCRMPCLPLPFVALSVRRRPGELENVGRVRSVSGQRRFRTARSACRSI